MVSGCTQREREREREREYIERHRPSTRSRGNKMARWNTREKRRGVRARGERRHLSRCVRASSLPPTPRDTTRYLVRELASGRSLSTNKQTDPSPRSLFSTRYSHRFSPDTHTHSLTLSLSPASLSPPSFPSKEEKSRRSLEQFSFSELGAAPRSPVRFDSASRVCGRNALAIAGGVSLSLSLSGCSNHPSVPGIAEFSLAMCNVALAVISRHARL